MTESANQPQQFPPPPQPDRHPTGEIGKKFSEGAAGLYVAARAVALEDHKRMLAMHANRLCQDHRAMQIAAGYRPSEDGIDCPDMKKGEDPMGDISVTGDQYYYSVPTTTQTSTNGKGSLLKTLLPWSVAALALLGLPFMYWLTRPSIQPVDTNTDTITEVTVE